MKPSPKLLLPLFSLVALICGHSFAAQEKTLKVFILSGQSNMQGHAKVSTFEHIGMDPATKPMLAEMLGADGKPKVCERVWISSIGCADTEQTGKLTAGFGASQNGPKIGPEFTFGILHGEVHRRSDSAHQNVVGRQKPEHRFPPTECRTV